MKIFEIFQKEKEAYPENRRTLSPEENVLSTREKIKRRSLGWGSNRPELVELKDDGTGVFKSEKNEDKGLRNTVREKYYLRERGAYLVDKFLALGLVPPTVLRSIDGDIGSLQQFVAGAKTGCEINIRNLLDNKKIRRGLIELWIFDYLIWNSDRNNGNFLVKDDKIFAIDNGLSFGHDALATNQEFWDERLPEDLCEKIGNFAKWEDGIKLLKDLLSELINTNEIDAFFSRFEKLNKFVQQNKTIPRNASLTYN